MKLFRVQSKQQDAPFYVVQENDCFWPVKDVYAGDFTIIGEGIDPSSVQIVAPSEPSKIVCVGINYHDHAEEMGHHIRKEPVIFLKPNTAVIANKDTIQGPENTRVDYEAEIAMVIGQRCKNVPVELAQDYVLGYTVLNDVTARDLQKVDGQWTRAKGFDTFCPCGPSIETDFAWQDAKIQGILNGKIVQENRTSSMIHTMNEIIHFISSVMTLLPGDVIATGTPSGIGPMQDGDVFEVCVEGLDSLSNRFHRTSLQ